MVARPVSEVISNERCQATYIADIDGLATLAAGCSIVGEWVRGSGGGTSIIASSSGRSPVATPAVASTTPVSSSITSTATTEPSSAAKAAAGADAPSKTATTAVAAARRARKAVFSDLKHASLPIVAIELGYGIPGVVGTLEGDYARALRTSVVAYVNICADNGPLLCYFAYKR